MYKKRIIAENIFEWWISGKSYKKWYADKFLQLKIDFDAEDKMKKLRKVMLSGKLKKPKAYEE